MLRNLFGSTRPEERQAILDYLKREIALNAVQDDEAGRYNQALTMHGGGLALGSDAARAVAAAAATMAAANRGLIDQHSQLGPVPDDAGPCYMAWHLTYLALSAWADSAAAAYEGIAKGASPLVGRVQQLLQEEERLRKRAMKEQSALMRRIKLTAEEARQLMI